MNEREWLLFIGVIAILLVIAPLLIITQFTTIEIETYLCQDKLGGENLEGIMCEREVEHFISPNFSPFLPIFLLIYVFLVLCIIFIFVERSKWFKS
jgi:hypothetical protein